MEQYVKNVTSLADSALGPISPLFDPFPRFFPSMWADFDLLPSTTNQAGETRVWTPRVDVYDTKDALVIDAELPGLAKSDIKMKVKDGMLLISCQ